MIEQVQEEAVLKILGRQAFLEDCIWFAGRASMKYGISDPGFSHITAFFQLTSEGRSWLKGYHDFDFSVIGQSTFFSWNKTEICHRGQLVLEVEWHQHYVEELKVRVFVPDPLWQEALKALVQNEREVITEELRKARELEEARVRYQKFKKNLKRVTANVAKEAARLQVVL